MNILSPKDIKKLSLRETGIYGSEAKLLVSSNKKVCYKKFTIQERSYLMEKARKLLFLSSIPPLEDAVLPQDIVYNSEKNLLEGYLMDYYPNTPTMYKMSTFYDEKGLRNFFMAVNLTSQALKRIHNRPEKIILGDASYQNLLILKDKTGVIMKSLCVDFDSATFGGLDFVNISTSELLGQYFAWLGIKSYNQNQNTDRLTRLLYFLHAIFYLDFLDLPLYEYDAACELSRTLRNLRNVVLELKQLKSERNIPYIPYMHEVLDLKDTLTLSRML